MLSDAYLMTSHKSCNSLDYLLRFNKDVRFVVVVAVFLTLLLAFVLLSHEERSKVLNEQFKPCVWLVSLILLLIKIKPFRKKRRNKFNNILNITKHHYIRKIKFIFGLSFSTLLSNISNINVMES